MANHKSGDSFTMSALISDTRIDRRLFRIPEDQKQLLDRDDAWTADSFVNVPPGVLEDVRRFHSRKQEPLDTFDAHGSSTNRQREHAVEKRPSSGHSNHSSSEELDDASGKGEEAAIPIEWSSSPEPRKAGNEPVPSTSSGLEEGAVEQRNNIISAKHLTTHFPSSSLAEEVDLDIEVPGAITDVVIPAQQRAKHLDHLGPTPPSAQVVPSTYPSTAGHPEEPEPKKRRRMKVPKFDEDPRTRRRGSAAPGRSRSPEAMALDNAEEGSPPPSSSPPFSVPASSSAEGGRKEAAAAKPAHTNRPEDTQASDDEGSSEPEAEHAVEATVHDDVEDQNYYATFKGAYVDYSGSLSIFVRGVMCLQDVAERRALPAFLFDDFIRVFSHEFMTYVAGLDDDEQPLTALQYYNEKVDEPTYTKRIVTGQNLMAILEVYKEEANEASLLLSLDEEEQGSEDGVADDNAEDMQAKEYSENDRREESAETSPTPADQSPLEVDESRQQDSAMAQTDAVIIESTSPESPEKTPQPAIDPEAGEPYALASQRIPETVVATRQKHLESTLVESSPRQKTKRRRKLEDPDSRSKRYKQFLQTNWIRRVASSSAAR